MHFDRPEYVDEREPRLLEDLMEAALLPDFLSIFEELVLALRNRLVLHQDAGRLPRDRLDHGALVEHLQVI